MQIRYTGKAGKRTIGPWKWNADNEFIADVTDINLVATLLTYPRPEFELVAAGDDEVENLTETLGIEKEKVQKLVVPAANAGGDGGCEQG